MGHAMTNTDMLKQRAEEAKKMGQEFLNVSGEKLAASYETIRKDLGKASSQLLSTIKKHPFATLGVAIGVGYLVGRVYMARHEKD